MKILRTIWGTEKGFTLLEILIAMIILAAAGSMIMLAYSQALMSTRLVNEQNMATNLARERIEFLKQYENSGKLWTDPVWQTNTQQPPYTVTSAGFAPEPNVNQVPVRVTVSRGVRVIVTIIAYYSLK